MSPATLLPQRCDRLGQSRDRRPPSHHYCSQPRHSWTQGALIVLSRAIAESSRVMTVLSGGIAELSRITAELSRGAAESCPDFASLRDGARMAARRGWSRKTPATRGHAWTAVLSLRLRLRCGNGHGPWELIPMPESKAKYDVSRKALPGPANVVEMPQLPAE